MHRRERSFSFGFSHAMAAGKRFLSRVAGTRAVCSCVFSPATFSSSEFSSSPSSSSSSTATAVPIAACSDSLSSEPQGTLSTCSCISSPARALSKRSTSSSSTRFPDQPFPLFRRRPRPSCEFSSCSLPSPADPRWVCFASLRRPPSACQPAPILFQSRPRLPSEECTPDGFGERPEATCARFPLLASPVSFSVSSLPVLVLFLFLLFIPALSAVSVSSKSFSRPPRGPFPSSSLSTSSRFFSWTRRQPSWASPKTDEPPGVYAARPRDLSRRDAKESLHACHPSLHTAAASGLDDGAYKRRRPPHAVPCSLGAARPIGRKEEARERTRESSGRLVSTVVDVTSFSSASAFFLFPLSPPHSEAVVPPADASSLRGSLASSLPAESALSPSFSLPLRSSSASVSPTWSLSSFFSSSFSPSSFASPLGSPLFAYGPKYPYPTQSNRINKKPPCVLSSPSAFPALLLTLPPLNITAVNPAYVGQHVRLPVLPSADFFSLLTAPRLAAFFPPSTRIRHYLRGPGGIEISDESQPYFSLLRDLSEARRRSEEENRSLDEERQGRQGEILPISAETRDAMEALPRAEETLVSARRELKGRASRPAPPRVQTPDRRVWTEYAHLLAFLKRRDETGAPGESAERRNEAGESRSASGGKQRVDRENTRPEIDDGEVPSDAEGREKEHSEYRVFFEEIAKISEKRKQMYKGKKPWREDLHPTKSIFDRPCFPGDALPYIQQHNEEMIKEGKLDQVINEDELRCDALWADDEGRIVKLKANVHISELRSASNPPPVTRERQALLAKLPNPEPQWRFVVTTHLGYIEEKKLKVGDVPEMFTPKHMREIWNNHFALPKRGRQPLVLDDGSIVP
ncbi:putative transmembrane protein [Toxoplasma gondii TgCatPRC2]|uniref:Transmembrane protein n=3 Tax=Toxoplasma gondii TaxID=5811 RepID=S8G672_TOXGM|nr:hypothetical protein TGME49_227115 [Toxoplasma gondii ME49]EPT27210.1 hypothetical protein TGME49_227115 [Toxoplasma gondii ME49]KYF43358.1 hypothetical protein TGARI_227115 [Toxoplasma gondii ARI]KYK69256.1 putative transmembrane protein [Toxoplasma gondii TgCatPRC2]|eukprot:XP_002366364.2 hypothetical protein TGME49_227115 [Toxoplasma gondii ME49]